MRLALLAATTATALALGGVSTAGAAPIKLVGTDGPGFHIVLTKGGKPLKVAKPDSYSLTVSDKSSLHNFHIFGPGLNKVVTTIAFVGKKTVSFKLKKGTYTYQCDAHAALGMKGSFKVS
jgi:plastocyanin